MSSLVSLKTATCGATMPLGYSFPHTIWCSNQTLPSQTLLLAQAGGTGANTSLVHGKITLLF